MRIGMEHAENKDLVQVRVDEVLGQLRPLRLDRGVVDSISAATLLDNHGLADETIDGAGDVDRRPIGEGRHETLDVARFLAEVDFLAQVAPDLLDNSRWLVMPQARD